MVQIFQQLRVLIEQIIMTLGYPGIAAVMFAENVFPPIPSELVMPFAGFMVAYERMNFFGVILAGTIGTVLGAVVLYYVGYWAEDHVVRGFVKRFGKFFLISEEDHDRALAFFNKHGQAVVFFGRLIPIIRSLISIPAGMNHMPMAKFLLFTTIGSVIWNSVLTAGGMILGNNWERIMEFVGHYEKATLAVVGLAVLAFIVIRLMKLWNNRLPQSSLNSD
jgi:membrane protein DedA with SNARE-associated domain